MTNASPSKPALTDKRKYNRTWKTWIFHPLVSLCSLMDEKLFPETTEEQKIETLLEAATLEAEQAAKTIRDHMFVQHMARAKIQALESWNHGSNLLCDNTNNLPLQG